MRTIAVFSGGLDSTVLLYSLIAAGDEVVGVSIDYGQRHRKELVHAERIAKQLGVSWRKVDLTGVAPLLAGSSQTSLSISVPYGHYAEESMKLTVVPNRNMILLAVAGGLGISLRFD